MKKFAAVLFGVMVAASGLALAAEIPEPGGPVHVNASIVNPIHRQVDEMVGSDCEWNEANVQRLVEMSRGSIALSSEDPATAKGRNLRLTVITMHAIGGLFFTGPKFVSIKAELFQDGKPLKSTILRPHSIAGLTACGIARKLTLRGMQLAAKWVNSNSNAAIIEEADDGPAAASETTPLGNADEASAPSK